MLNLMLSISRLFCELELEEDLLLLCFAQNKVNDLSWDASAYLLLLTLLVKSLLTFHWTDHKLKNTSVYLSLTDTLSHQVNVLTRKRCYYNKLCQYQKYRVRIKPEKDT